MTFKEYIKNNPIDLDIKNLNLYNEYLTDIYGIEEYKNLEILVLSHNSIINIDSLLSLPKLKVLYLHDNPIYKNYMDCRDYYYYNVIYDIDKLKRTISINRRKRIISEL